MFKTIVNSIPYVLFGIFLFFSVSFLFGMENFILATIFLLLAKSLVKSSLSKFNYFKYGLLLVIIGIIACICSINIFVTVILNFITLFLITFIYSDEFAPKNHVLLGLELVLLQLIPVDFDGFIMRILAIIYCYGALLIFIYGMHKIKGDNKNKYVDESYNFLVDNLRKVKGRNSENINVSEVYKLTSIYCFDIHENVLNQGGVLNEGEKFNFYLLMHAEELSQLLYDISKHHEKLNKKDYKYFSRLAKILENHDDYDKLRCKIKEFISKNRLTDDYFNEDFKLVLSSLVRVLENNKKYGNKDTDVRKSFRVRFKYAKHRFNFKNQSFRFAMQTAILVAISFLVSGLVPTEEGTWIATATYTAISLYPDDAFKNMIKRVLGMVFGFLVFALVTRYIPSSIRLILVLFIGYMVMASTESKFIKTLVGTQLAIISVYPDLGLTLSVFLRMTLVMIGFTIVIFGVRFIIKTKKEDAFEIKLNELINRNRDLIFELEKIFKNKNPYNTGVMMMIHLIMKELHDLEDSQDVLNKDNVDKILNYNYRFITDINRTAMVIDSDSITSDEKDLIKEEIGLIDRVAKGKFCESNMPKSIYQVKRDTDSYMEFQMEKSRFTIGKFQRKLRQSKK